MQVGYSYYEGTMLVKLKVLAGSDERALSKCFRSQWEIRYTSIDTLVTYPGESIVS